MNRSKVYPSEECKLKRLADKRVKRYPLIFLNESAKKQINILKAQAQHPQMKAVVQKENIESMDSGYDSSNENLIWPSGVPTWAVLRRAPSLDMIESHLKIVMARQNESNAVLIHQMDSMQSKVEDELTNLPKNRGKALTPTAITHLFSLCEYFEVTDRVKYTAAEIYDRFMVNYNEFLGKELAGHDKALVKETEIRVEGQTLLRLATCIQLASKIFHSNYGYQNVSLPIASVQILVMLNQNLQSSTLKAINDSELRVLSLMKYNVNCLITLDIVENILIQLELDIPIYRKIYELSMHLLDYIYFAHEEVYDCMYKLVQTKTPDLERKTFKRIEHNKLIEASGIVACCIYTFKSAEYKVYLHAISAITQVERDIFTDLAAILVKCMDEVVQLQRNSGRT